LQVVILFALPTLIFHTVALSFLSFCTYKLLVYLSFIALIATCSLLGYPVAVINKTAISENGKNKVNGTEMCITSATGRETVKNMEKRANNSAHYDWLCIRMTLRIMQ